MVDKAQTIAIASRAVFELFNCYNCRHDAYSIFRIGWFGNKWLNWAVLSSLALTLMAMYVPGSPGLSGWSPCSGRIGWYWLRLDSPWWSSRKW